MFDLFEQIEQSIHNMLVSFIVSNFTGMFTDVNDKRTIPIYFLVD